MTADVGAIVSSEDDSCATCPGDINCAWPHCVDPHLVALDEKRPNDLFDDTEPEEDNG